MMEAIAVDLGYMEKGLCQYNFGQMIEREGKLEEFPGISDRTY
jgi:hypothetical protein